MEFMKNVLSYGIIKAMCEINQGCDCGTFNFCGSHSSDEAIGYLKNLFLPLKPSEFDRLEISMGADNKNVASIPAGYYLYIYDNPLPLLRINYSMKVETVIDYGGPQPQFSEIYLYYLGDND